MIRCPNCNSENPLGAIFCRSCGERIDIENLSPSEIQKGAQAGKAVKAIAGGVRNLIGVVVLVAVVGALGSIFLSPTYTPAAALSEQESGVALKRFGKLMKARKGEFAFSDAEATVIARQITFLTEKDKVENAGVDGPALAPDDITVNFLPPNRVRLVLKSIVKEKVTMYSVIEGSLTPGSPGLTFTPIKCYSGKAPMPGEAAMNVIYDRFRPLLDNNARWDKFSNTVMKRAKEVTVEAGKIAIRK